MFRQITKRWITVSPERMEELMRSEVTHFSSLKLGQLGLKDVLAHKNPQDLVQTLQTELPKRYAQSIIRLETLLKLSPNKYFSDILHKYRESFANIRDLGECPLSLDEAVAVFQQIQARHRKTALLIKGFRGLKGSAEVQNFGDLMNEPGLVGVSPQTQVETWINQFLADFFESRIQTTLGINQFLELATGGHGILKAIKVSAITELAISSVKSLCASLYTAEVLPAIQILDGHELTLEFIPQHLYFIMFELLKNAARASIEFGRQTGQERRPISITISQFAGSSYTGIRICDHGGGIPVETLDHVWSYLYSTAPTASTTSMGVEEPIHSFNSLDIDSQAIPGGPLAGIGCGLPLVKLYTEFLQGSIQLCSMPNYGTDVFVFLYGVET